MNEEHARKIIEAFKFRAEYQWGLPSLGGRRYKRIVVFTDAARGAGDREVTLLQRYWFEYLPTLLVRNGDIVTI